MAVRNINFFYIGIKLLRRAIPPRRLYCGLGLALILMLRLKLSGISWLSGFESTTLRPLSSTTTSQHFPTESVRSRPRQTINCCGEGDGRHRQSEG